MTRRLRGLLVDDIPANLALIERTLTFAFRKLDYAVEWRTCQTALDAFYLIDDARSAANPEEFDFAIVDVQLGPDDLDGLAVVDHLVASGCTGYILVVTAYWGEQPDIGTRAAGLKAHDTIARRLLLRSPGPWSPDTLAQKVLNHLVREGHLTVGTVNYDRGDPGIVSVLDSIGEGSGPERTDRGARIVRNLTVQCIGGQLPDQADLYLSYLAPGRSGAYVCRVDRITARHAAGTEPTGITASVPAATTASYVVKIGMDRRTLERECGANREARAVLREQTLVAVSEVQSDPSGFHAIAARLAESAVPLRSWLCLPTTTVGQAATVADALFRDHLASLFRTGGRSAPLEGWLPLTSWQKIRAREVLQRYEKALGHPAAAARRDADRVSEVLRAYIERGAVPARTGPPPAPVVLRNGFGDLHSANVLIQSGVFPVPVLIDAALFGAHHWSADTARLVVDVLLRARQPGVTSMLWSDFSALLRHAVRLCPHSERRLDDGDAEPAVAFVAGICRTLPEYLNLGEHGVPERDWHWQWHVALAKEFLRQSCHEDLTPMRATAALGAAAYHLRFAGRLIDA